LSNLLSRSREYYEDEATTVRAVTARLKKFNAESIRLEHKRRAVDLELKAVEKRVLKELNNAQLEEAMHITATGVRAALSHTEYKAPAGKPMVMIFEDGSVRAGYGFMPVGPRILDSDEFENLITILINRASTEQLDSEPQAAEIVRHYFREEFMKDPV
jgi:hypothetical protein